MEVEREREEEVAERSEEVDAVERKNISIPDLSKKFGEIIDVSTLKLLENELVEKIVEDEKRNYRRYPNWIKNVWPYIKPHKNFLGKWFEMWKQVLLIYLANERSFLVNVAELANSFPFYNSSIGKGIGVDALREIVDRLVKDGLARWLDKNKVTAVVYWQSLENIIQKILKYSREIGLKYITLDLLDKVWPNLPVDEKIKILNDIVSSKKGSWVIKNYAVKLFNGVEE